MKIVLQNFKATPGQLDLLKEFVATLKEDGDYDSRGALMSRGVGLCMGGTLYIYFEDDYPDYEVVE